MRALVTTSGDSSRLPGPPPKSFRLLDGKPVVGHIIDELEQCSFITQIDVIVRHDQRDWAVRALGGSYECDLIPQGTLGLTERIRQARSGEEALVVCLGDTLVQRHADQLRILVANKRGPRARVLIDRHDVKVLGAHSERGITELTIEDVLVDVGSYYIPKGFPLLDGDDESLMRSLMASGVVDPVKLGQNIHWRDVGTPEGFAAAELAVANGRL